MRHYARAVYAVVVCLSIRLQQSFFSAENYSLVTVAQVGDATDRLAREVRV